MSSAGIKALCAVISVSIVLSLASCTGSSLENDADDTSAGTDESTVSFNETGPEFESDSLPGSLDFGEETVVVLSHSIYNDEGIADNLPEFTVEDLMSEPVNDSLYNRKISVEERLNIKINNVQVRKSQMEEEMKKQFDSQDDIYDVVISSAHSISSYVLDGLLTDLYELDYIDFSKPWWSDKFNREAEIEGSLYMTTGSLSLTLLRNLYTVFFNKRLAENYGVRNTELSELYSLVEKGGWTFDKFVELGGAIYEDVNGNDTADMEDVYGIIYSDYLPLDAIWSGFDIKIFTKNEDGWFDFAVNTDKLYSALDKLYDLICNVRGSITSSGLKIDFYDDTSRLFAGGNGLFMVNWLGVAETPELRNMQDDYGMLPYPKYDESQKEYYSYSHDQYTAFAIPLTNDRPGTAAAMLEAMASYAYRDTVPKFLDVALKGKYMSDADSRKTVDTVVNGFMLDAAWIYLGNLAVEYPASFRYMIAERNPAFSSNHEKMAKKVQLNLKVYKSVYENNNAK